MAQRVSQYFGSTLDNATTGVNTATNLAVGFSTSAVAAAETPFQVSGNASISGSLKVGTAVTINQTSGTISAVLFDGAFSGIITSAVNLVGGIATASSLLVTGITSVSNSGVNIGNVYTTGVTTAIVTGTAVTSIISLRSSIFRSVKYQVQIAQGSNFQATDILTVHNGTTANLIEYGTVATGDYLGSFDASITNDFTSVVSTAGTVGISTEFITGINTSSISIGQKIVGLSTIVSVGTTVISIGIGTVGIGTTTVNTEAQQGVSFTFGNTNANLNLNYTPNVSAAATISVAYHAMRII